MERSTENGKFILQNQLRTWLELKRKAAKEKQQKATHAPPIPARRWISRPDGTPQQHDENLTTPEAEKEDHSVAMSDADSAVTASSKDTVGRVDQERTPQDKTGKPSQSTTKELRLPLRPAPSSYHMGRDAGGTLSGAATPAGDSAGDDDAESQDDDASPGPMASTATNKMAKPSKDYFNAGTPSSTTKRGKPQRRPTEQDLENWVRQSGMGSGARADALGDEPEEDDEEEENGDKIQQEREGPSEIAEQEKQDKSVQGSVY